MVSNEKHNREALEKLFPKPFTDYQWSLLSAQGYEEALASGARTVADVAQELQQLIEVARRRATASDRNLPDDTAEPPLGWDEMEKLVLGRILSTGETSGPKVTPGAPGSGVRVRRLAADRGRLRQRWWIVVVSCLAVLVLAAVILLLFWGQQWGVWGGSSATTLTTDSSQTGVEAAILPSRPTTTSSTLPPITIPASNASVYTAQLSGSEVVPAVSTAATGNLELTLSDDGLSVGYVLTVDKVAGLTVVRLRVGEAGVNGEEIVTLYPGPAKKGLFSGEVVHWWFDAAALVGQLKGKTMADFVALIEAGSVYVNVGTTGNRDGELRGQLQ